MRGIVITSLICILSVMTSTDLLQAQAIIEGRITDAGTGEPLHGAHVFLSETKIGTATNPSGHYRLRRIMPGAHRLVVSMIGYGRASVDLVIGSGEIKKVDVELEPAVYKMEEIYVGNLDK